MGFETAGKPLPHAPISIFHRGQAVGRVTCNYAHIATSYFAAAGRLSPAASGHYLGRRRNEAVFDTTTLSTEKVAQFTAARLPELHSAPFGRSASIVISSH